MGTDSTFYESNQITVIIRFSPPPVRGLIQNSTFKRGGLFKSHPHCYTGGGGLLKNSPSKEESYSIGPYLKRGGGGGYITVFRY